MFKRIPRRNHITPVLRELHWLKIHDRIIFTILLLTHKTFNNTAPEYFRDLFRFNVKSTTIRTCSSFDPCLLCVPPINKRCANSLFDRSFAFATPTLWNALDLDIRILPFDALKKVQTHLSVSTMCIYSDYCVYHYKSTDLVSLYTLDNPSLDVIERLQWIQNQASRMFKRIPRRSHITPVLRELNWLKINDIIIFTILLLTHNTFNNTAPEYFRDLFRFNVKSTTIRTCSSFDPCLLCVPPISKRCANSLFYRSFVFAAPTLWNTLDLDIRILPFDA